MKKIIVSNPEKCTGCRVCESVCSLVHTGRCNPAESRIRVMRWETKGLDIPVTCLQCEDPICEMVCPVNAISRNPDTGAMETNHDICIKCYMCVMACPFGGSLIAPNGDVLRCDLCGGEPQCVTLCQTKAIEYKRVDKVGVTKMRKAIKHFPSLYRVEKSM
ncbi:MAG: 4Fe-4S dicluster domain-containing protein [Deltaproteobacteria bacterium]|nr:4Fe-4S dicluster domain-containing protein [Deltaproteobacteria bacterium]